MLQCLLHVVKQYLHKQSKLRTSHMIAAASTVTSGGNQDRAWSWTTTQIEQEKNGRRIQLPKIYLLDLLLRQGLM